MHGIAKPKPNLEMLAEITSIRTLRDALKFSRPMFARIMACSERSLANWEQGRELPAVYKGRLTELQNLHLKMSEIVGPGAVGQWITEPSNDLAGLKPLELIERGDFFRLWQFILSPETVNRDDSKP